MRKSSDKQFHYRRLANEKTPTKSKPNRPPQPQAPKAGGSAREELLIDISPEEDVVLRRKSQAQQHASPRSVSLLDEPIDVPQDGMYRFFESVFGKVSKQNADYNKRRNVFTLATGHKFEDVRRILRNKHAFWKKLMKNCPNLR